MLRLTSWLLASACAAPLLAQNYTQTITLNPGWNSVFLEVTPADTNIADVFSDPAIMTVWTPKVRNSTVAFIQNPNAAPFNTAGWMVYMPTNQPGSVNNDLYTVVVNTPYVIQVAGSNAVTLNVTGRPSLQPWPFVPDAFTLRGFPVDPANPPAFQTFFQSSPAHDNNGAGPLTAIYQLNLSTGQWQQANATNPMAREVAYWVYTTGASSYMASLTASCQTGDGLDFGQQGLQLNLTLQNMTSNAMDVTITDLGGLPRPLVYSVVTNPATQVSAWMPLPQTLPANLPPGGTTVLQMAIQRSQMVNGSYATVLALSDGNGTLLHVPVTAQASTNLLAGLWVGDITVSNVAETYNTNNPNPTPTASPFVMRAILHVRPDGTTRFLREVIEMLQSAVTGTNGSGQVVTVQPAQNVLLTDKTLLSQFTGVVLRDGTPAGRRVSTAGFDFDPPGGVNYLTMTGTFGIGNTVSVSITLTPQTPTNPFLHRYNPDHDNLDANYNPLPPNGPQEVYTVTRQIQFTFTPTDPSGQTATDYGTTEIGGIYNETLTGLHRNPLVVSGTFHLAHTMSVPYLNVNQ
jgi:hypothetical protein